MLALKGQLVKGSGYLLAGKGKVVSKAGDYITSFGKQLAASAVVEPKPYPPDTYYDHPPVQGIRKCATRSLSKAKVTSKFSVKTREETIN